MILDKFKKEKRSNLSIEHFDGCPAFIEMTFYGFVNRFTGDKSIPNDKGVVCYFTKEQGDFISLVSDQKEIAVDLINKQIKDSEYILNLHEHWYKKFIALMDFYYKNFNKNLSILSDTELIDWSKQITKKYKEEVMLPGFIDGFMFYADQRLSELLNNQDHYIKLTTPTAQSFIKEEEVDIIRHLNNEKFDIEKTDYPKWFADHLNKFSYIMSSYAGYQNYTADHLIAKIKEIDVSHPVEVSFEKLIQEKKDFINKLKFSPEIIAITQLFDTLLKWQDERKQYTLTFVGLKNKILDEVARRVDIDRKLLKYIYGDLEIEDCLNRKIKANKLEIRRQACVITYREIDEMEILEGDEAKEYFNQISHIDVGETREIKGYVASVGKWTGKVRLLKSVADISKVRKDEVLVAAMTRPEHIVAMKLAGAIITDDGGITCHAAIVSRELKKPCIIGTKISTKVLKDGDLVEVDANLGIIKILS